MKTKIHAIAGVAGFLIIATFWTSTAISELLGSHDTIVMVKNAILYGMVILIPAMAIAGGSGMSLGQGRGDAQVLAKKKRMPFIAMNGLLILVPCAFFLASKANAGAFDTTFYLVQAVELIAGATNLTLMGFNIRDGLRLTGRIPASRVSESNEVASISIRENGPAVFSGLKSCIGTDGTPITTKPTMALCRCGASRNKPYCDGSHNAANFSDQKSPGPHRRRSADLRGRTHHGALQPPVVLQGLRVRPQTTKCLRHRA